MRHIKNNSRRCYLLQKEALENKINIKRINNHRNNRRNFTQSEIYTNVEF